MSDVVIEKMVKQNGFSIAVDRSVEVSNDAVLYIEFNEPYLKLTRVLEILNILEISLDDERVTLVSNLESECTAVRIQFSPEDFEVTG